MKSLRFYFRSICGGQGDAHGLRAICISIVLLAGCSSSPQPVFSSDAHAKAGLSSSGSSGGQSSVADDPGSTQDNALRLERLWRMRTDAARDAQSSNFLLGPGDVLRISLPQLEGQKDRTVRVTEDSTIALPLLGVINVSGMREAALREELTRREQIYVYAPQVGVFLEHSENRNVAVLGSVKTPGRYIVASRDDTVLTMIARAGGLTEDAASQIILVPAQPDRRSKAPERITQATDIPSSSPLDNVFETRENLSDQVVIEVRRKSAPDYLQLPARSGDVIIVPSAGEVTVEGWVQNPGKFKITEGMTALGAIAAAGGAQFSQSAVLLREETAGRKLTLPLDLSRIEKGIEPDASLEQGDVIIVKRSVVGAVPYSLYFVASHIGLGVPLF